MFSIVSPTTEYGATYTFLESFDVAKEDHLFENGYDKLALSYALCSRVGIRSVCCNRYENKTLLSISNMNLLISYSIFPFLYY